VETILVYFLLIQVIVRIGPCATTLRQKDIEFVKSTTNKMSFLRLFELPAKEVRVILLASGVITSCTIIYKKVKKRRENDEEKK
jgi:hypothetical protein